MKQEQDHDLHRLLAAYEVDDMSPASQKALLDTIVAAARLEPQCPASAIRRFFASGLPSNAAALVVIALLGFWIGTGSAKTASTGTALAEKAASSGEEYLNKVVFGPKSWKEVRL